VSIGDEKITINVDINVHLDSGIVQSTIIGPAKEWKSLHWNHTTIDNLSQNDTNYIEIFGININNQYTKLFEGYVKDTLLNFIPASIYPRIQLNWITQDTINNTSSQLKYWRVHYTPYPESAINRNIALKIEKDSLEYGENLKLHVGVENISDYDMDSLLISYKIIDRNNTTHEISQVRYKKLMAHDTLLATMEFDVRNFTGLNYIYRS
jgi:hypothetical protein